MSVVTLLGWIVASVFAWAAVSKVAAPRRWSVALAAYRLPDALRAVALPAVPLLELSVGVLGIAGHPRPAVVGGLVLLVAFSAATVRASDGSRLPCGCFGRTKTKDPRAILARNAALVLLCLVTLATPAGWLVEPQAPSGGDVLPAALVAIGVLVGAWATIRASSALRTKRYP